MKLLVVGFSAQNASALQLLVGRAYPECTLVVVERSFDDELRLCLPKATAAHRDAAAVILNLDGVGMLTYSPQHIKPLQAFIGVRPALMITKGSTLTWQQAGVLPDGFVLFLTSPYGRELMETAIGRLLSVAPSAFDRRHDFACYQESDGLTASLPAAPKKTKLVAGQNFLHHILDVHFNIRQNPLLHEFADVILEEGALKLVAGSQVFYINRAKNLALVMNFERLLDYCVIANNFEVATNVIAIDPISEDEFDKWAAQSPLNGYKKYALNTLLWQMYGHILPERIDVPDHKLQLKLRFMPNFAQMKDMPEYVRALASTCLVAPRQLSELTTGLGATIDKAIVNRIFLLAILSGTADFEVLERSFEYQDESLPIKKVANQGVQKAQKTGFLARLLSKLSLR